jgi:hypothetical protein
MQLPSPFHVETETRNPLIFLNERSHTACIPFLHLASHSA